MSTVWYTNRANCFNSDTDAWCQNIFWVIAFSVIKYNFFAFSLQLSREKYSQISYLQGWLSGLQGSNNEPLPVGIPNCPSHDRMLIGLSDCSVQGWKSFDVSGCLFHESIPLVLTCCLFHSLLGLTLPGISFHLCPRVAISGCLILGHLPVMVSCWPCIKTKLSKTKNAFILQYAVPVFLTIFLRIYILYFRNREVIECN